MKLWMVLITVILHSCSTWMQVEFKLRLWKTLRLIFILWIVGVLYNTCIKTKLTYNVLNFFLNKKVRNTCKQQLPATEIHLTAGTVEFELKLWTGENLALSRMTATLQIQILTPKGLTNLERHSKFHAGTHFTCC